MTRTASQFGGSDNSISFSGSLTLKWDAIKSSPSLSLAGDSFSVFICFVLKIITGAPPNGQTKALAPKCSCNLSPYFLTKGFLLSGHVGHSRSDAIFECFFDTDFEGFSNQHNPGSRTFLSTRAI
jgi:hypothetical protein